MNSGYQLTLEAQAHVDEIGAYISRDSVDAALRIYDALEEAFELLAQSPGIGHTREDLRSSGASTRILSSTTPRADRSGIITVLRGARDVEHLLKGK